LWETNWREKWVFFGWKREVGIMEKGSLVFPLIKRKEEWEKGEDEWERL
jgi:hypothetical protein